METVINFFKDNVTDFAIGSVITLLVAFLLSLVKQGKFLDYGVICGRAVSKFGTYRLGKNLWEKFETAFKVIILGFTRGFVIGLELDNEDVKEITQGMEQLHYENNSEE